MVCEILDLLLCDVGWGEVENIYMVFVCVRVYCVEVEVFVVAFVERVDVFERVRVVDFCDFVVVMVLFVLLIV